MLKRFNITVPSDYEEPLLGLAEFLAVTAFSNPLIRDEGTGETDFVYTGEIVVSFIVSTIEQDLASIETAIEDWLKDFGLPSNAISSEEYSENQDWMINFKQFFRPIQLGEEIVIRPPWEAPLPCEGNAVTLIIDPGMAFGTGTHETTRLCLGFLSKLDVKGQYFLDLGAGSGILSFYLMKKEADSGVAIEIEGAAVENMKKNAELNHIPKGLDMICADLGKYEPVKLADGVVANITSPVILEYLPLFSKWVKKGGWGVFSGVNSANAELVKKAFKENGWTDLKEKIDGDWHGFYLIKN